MHTPESKLDADLRDLCLDRDLDADLRALGLDRDLLDACSDLPVNDLDIPLAALDLPAPKDLGESAPRTDHRAASETPSAVLGTSSKSVRITIRIPSAVLEGFKAHAAPGSTGYQTLMVHALREWLSGRGRR